MPARIEIFTDDAGGHRFRLVGGNGQKMAASQAYTRKTSARRAARRIVAVCDDLAFQADLYGHPEAVIVEADS